jgi:hypothetical protein
MSLSHLIECLEQGVVPDELNYTAEANANRELDWEKLAYNVKYNSFEYFDNKLPNDLKNIPAYDKIVDLIVDKNKDNSPLKELEQRIEESRKDNNIELYGEEVQRE